MKRAALVFFGVLGLALVAACDCEWDGTCGEERPEPVISDCGGCGWDQCCAPEPCNCCQPTCCDPCDDPCDDHCDEPSGDCEPRTCELRVTLIGADADFTSDLYLDVAGPDPLILDTTNNVGDEVVFEVDLAYGILFYVMVYPDAGDYYWVYSDTDWAKVRQTGSSRWEIGFEDKPFPEVCDYDFDDVVIEVEVSGCPGMAPAGVGD